MQNDQTPGFQNDKIKPGWESTCKNTKPMKSKFYPEWLGIFGWNFVWSVSGNLVFSGIKIKKETKVKMGHSDRLKICVDPSKFTLTLAFKSI